MKLITFPQMREDTNGNMVSGNVFINPKHVVGVVSCEDQNRYGWCEILLHTQGTVLIGMCAEEVSRLLEYSGPTSMGFGPKPKREGWIECNSCGDLVEYDHMMDGDVCLGCKAAGITPP